MCLVKVWAVVVTQLVKQSLPTSEVRGSNPVIGKLLYRAFNCLPTVNCIEKTKIKKKRPGMVLFKKKCKSWAARLHKRREEVVPMQSIENKFTRTRARFTIGKKLCPLFYRFFS